MTLDEIKAAIREMDPDLDENEPAFKTATLLLASTQIGHDQWKLAKFCRLPRSYVRERAENFKANGIWRNGKIIAGNWFDEEEGGIAFWLDVTVGDGLLQRTA